MTALRLGLITGLSFEEGLNLWIDYTKISIINSKGLCAVLSIEDDIMTGLTEYFSMVKNQLIHQCGIGESFFDDNNNFLSFLSNHHHHEQFHFHVNYTLWNSPMFYTAIRIYNDLRNGLALLDGYTWADFQHTHSIVDENSNIYDIYQGLKSQYQNFLIRTKTLQYFV
jgi:hypothetical protein